MIYAVGDIHGMYNKLSALLEFIYPKLDKEDQLVFLGDYIDRGPDTPKVLETLIQLKQSRPNTIFLCGNHEEMFLKFYYELGAAVTSGPYNTKEVRDNIIAAFLGDNFKMWWGNGGKDTSKSYQYQEGAWESFIDLIPQDHIDFMDSLDVIYDTANYLFVHGGMFRGWMSSPDVPRIWEGYDQRLWVRPSQYTKQEQREHFTFDKTVVHGHTPTHNDKPDIMHSLVNIDTGSCFYAKLTVAAFDPEKPFDEKDFQYWQF